MKIAPRLVCIVLIFISALSFAGTQKNVFSHLNQLDARQQQQAESLQFQPSGDVRFHIAQSGFVLPDNESPCYPINQISLVNYSPDNSFKSSQFQWAFERAVNTLNLILLRCLGGEGMGILMKQIQNNIEYLME